MVRLWKRFVEFQGITNDALDIYFRSIGDVKNEDNPKLEISIFNLSYALSETFKVGKIATLKAGYKDDYGIIFRGVIDKKRSEIVGSDVSTILTLKQSEYPALQKKIEGTIPVGYTIEKAISQILSTVGIPIGTITETNVTLKRARPFETQPAIKLIRELTKEVSDKGFEFFTRDGEAYFVKHTEGKSEGYVVSFNNALLEAKPIEESAGEYEEKADDDNDNEEEEEASEDKPGTKGYNIKTLLLWKIRQGSLIEIKSDRPRGISGVMKVLNYAHICTDNDFVTEMEVRPI